MRSVFSKVLAGALSAAVLAGLLAAGCSSQKRRDAALADYRKVTLAELQAEPRGFVTRKVAFEAYFAAKTNLYPTFPTAFNKTDYVNFTVWPRGARLWKAEEIRASFPFLYVPRDAGGLLHKAPEDPLEILDALQKFQPVTIYGTVEMDTNNNPWVVVEVFRTIDAPTYRADLIRRLKLADERFAAKEYPLAVKDYRGALALGVPAEVEGPVRKSLGLSLLVLEEWTASAKELSLGADLGARDTECLIGLAAAQNELDRFAEAEKNARAALKKSPRSSQARAELAVALGGQKRFSAALAECADGLKLAAENADLLRAKGLVEDLAGKMDEAVKSYQAAVGARPGDSRIQRELGQIYVKKGDFKNARLSFENVVAVSRAHTLRYCRGHCLLAGVLEVLKEPAEEALKSYRLAQKRDETYVPAYMGLGALLAAGGKHPESVAEFKVVARRLDPKGDEGFRAWRSMAAVYYEMAKRKPVNLAKTRWKQEKPDRKAALAALAECVKLKPEASVPHYLSGCILDELKDLVAAARELETAKRLDPLHARTRLRLGLVYRDRGLDNQAVSEFRAAAELVPKESSALVLNVKNSLAYVLADAGKAADLAEAEKLAKEVVAAKGGQAAYVDTLGWVQARAGRVREAERTLEQAAGLAADGEVDVFYHLGYVYASLQKYSRAIETLGKAELRLSRSGASYPRAVRLKAAVKNLLTKVKTEKARLDAERRRKVGAVGDPSKQSSSPRAGGTRGGRPKKVE